MDKNQQINIKNIYNLLTEAFEAKELRRFCQHENDFKELYKQLPDTMGKDVIVDKLIDYATRKELFASILNWAKEKNPVKYKKHQPYHKGEPSKASPPLGNNPFTSPPPGEIEGGQNPDGTPNPTITASTLPTINRHQAIQHFAHLIQPHSTLRILRLTGDAKMGKTHLLTKVFPHLARHQYGAKCIIIDLQDPTQTIPDILNHLANHLSHIIPCPTFQSAYQTWLNTSTTPNPTRQSFLSFLSQRTTDPQENNQKHIRTLTTHLVNDLKTAPQWPSITLPLLLFFDAAEKAPALTQQWLIHTLFVQLSSLAHLRLIIAGRTLPDPSASYTPYCQSCHLEPVKDPTDYEAYCQQLKISLSLDQIKALTHAFDYRPGEFVNIIPKFSGGITHG